MDHPKHYGWAHQVYKDKYTLVRLPSPQKNDKDLAITCWINSSAIPRGLSWFCYRMWEEKASNEERASWTPLKKKHKNGNRSSSPNCSMAATAWDFQGVVLRKSKCKPGPCEQRLVCLIPTLKWIWGWGPPKSQEITYLESFQSDNSTTPFTMQRSPAKMNNKSIVARRRYRVPQMGT